MFYSPREGLGVVPVVTAFSLDHFARFGRGTFRLGEALRDCPDVLWSWRLLSKGSVWASAWLSVVSRDFIGSLLAASTMREHLSCIPFFSPHMRVELSTILCARCCAPAATNDDDKTRFRPLSLGGLFSRG